MYTRNLLSLIGVLFFGNYLVGKVNAGCQFTTNADTSVDEWSECTANSFIHISSKCTSGNNCETDAALDQTVDHVLYYCASATSCEELTEIGYYTDGTNVYYCAASSQCKKVTPTGTCESDAIGTLIVKNNKPELCLDGTISVGFPSSGTKYYSISYGAQSVFVSKVTSDAMYGIVEVTGKSIKFSTKTSVCIKRTSLEVTDKESSCGNGEKERSCTAGVCNKTCDTSNGDDCEAGKYYLVTTQGGSTGHLHLCTSSTAACTEETAKGYYTDGTNLYSCTASGACKSETLNTLSNCESNIGEVVSISSKISFCPNGSASPVELKENAGDYLVAKGTNSGTVYGLDADTEFAVVTVGANSVTMKTIAATGYYLVNSSTFALVTTNGGEGSLYKCETGTNICTAVVIADVPVGYLINGGNGSGSVPYIECKVDASSSSTKCKAIAVSAKACSTAKTGGLIVDSSKYKLCLNDDTTTVELLATTANPTYYMIGITGTGNVFGKAVDSFVIIDVKDGNAVLQDLTSKGGKYIANSSTQAVLTAAGNGIVYDCNESTKQCTKPEITVGYFKNADTTTTVAAAIPYIQCSSTQCSGIGITETSCSATTIGKLIKDATTPTNINLCVSATTTDAASLATPGQFMVSINVDNSIFGSKSDDYVVVDLDGDGAVTLVSIANDGYYIADDASYELANANESEGLLYSCTASTKKCALVSVANSPLGYIVNAGDTTPDTVPYISCVAGDNDTVTCKAVAVSDAACSSAKTGGLIKSGSGDSAVYSLCIDEKSSGVVLDKAVTTTTEYIVGVNDGNVFGDEDDSFVIVDISKGNAILHGKEESPDRYEFTDNTGARIDKSNFDSGNCQSGALISNYKVTEYKLNEEAIDTTNNYYTAVSTGE